MAGIVFDPEKIKAFKVAFGDKREEQRKKNRKKRRKEAFEDMEKKDK